MSTRSMSTINSLRLRGRGHKERSKNFTELEKRTVLELIGQHRDVLKQGRSNNATNKNKQLVWSTICAEVNKRCGGDRPRTPAQVKMWYENYKKKCKMRAHDTQQSQHNTASAQEQTNSILDGMLWQNIHPLGSIKISDEDENIESKDDEDECTPVNMTRIPSSNESNDCLTNILEPHVTIIPQLSPTSNSKPIQLNTTLSNHLQLISSTVQDFTRIKNYTENAPLNLSHLDSSEESRRKSGSSEIESRRNKYFEKKLDKNTELISDEERLYYTQKRQHAIWEHEAKMKILNMELRQKEEIFSLQKQLFLIELKLKMDFLEKACGK